MKKILHCVIVWCCLYPFSPLWAQGKYWVFFTDKDDSQFDPYAFFDAKVIERRQQQGIPLVEFSDVPVNTEYIRSVAAYCDSVSYASRWFNALACYASPEQIKRVSALPFVAAIEEMQAYEATLTSFDPESLSPGGRNLLQAQTARMQREAFSRRGFTGKGIRVALIDAGFSGFDKSEALQHVIQQKRLIATYDFVKRDAYVFRGHVHGTMVASCVAGMADTIPIGLAPDAELLLARTEKALSEKLREEENWVAAMEWAEQHGADIINSSLGYTRRRYFQETMDGSGLVSRAATLASRKGIIVVISAGNEGNDAWKTICAPGDADSILTVGGINPWTGIHASWSSYGPSADKRLKPNVSAYGYAVVSGRSSLEITSGTSFASPLVAGFAACLKQMNPALTPASAYEALQQSSDLYPYYDYVHGYGVPQASFFFREKPDSIAEPTVEIVREKGMLHVRILPSFFSIAEPSVFMPEDPLAEEETDLLDFRPSRHLPDESLNFSEGYCYRAFPGYLFLHVENKEAYLEYYEVYSVHQTEVVQLSADRFPKGSRLRVHYKGYTLQLDF